MCRLFALTAGRRVTHATFWLLDAPDSLTKQSRREPDGTGLGWFDGDGTPFIDKSPCAAYEDDSFWREARSVRSQSFLAHVRFASTGHLTLENTHPFEQYGRLFAHNGVIENLSKLADELGDYRQLVAGETDSELFFALITKNVNEHNGDVGAGMAEAARWVARELPLYAINAIVTSGPEVWALRYPETHDLFVLERAPQGPLHHKGSGHMRVHAPDLAGAPAVVFATEQMDASSRWRNLGSGELVHVDADLNVRSELAVAEPPAQLLTLDDLSESAAASQREP
jgi:predicted glutamine amidotransferase